MSAKQSLTLQQTPTLKLQSLTLHATSVNAKMIEAHPHIGIGGEFKNQA